jgi:preprotein translocase subunit SecA
MRPHEPVLGAGIYPERIDEPESFGDRVLGSIGYRLHRIAGRGPRDTTLLVDGVSGHVSRFGAGQLAPRVPELRYQIRRLGWRDDLIEEAMALTVSAIGQLPPPQVLGAARAMLLGRIAVLPDRGERRVALLLAAAMQALSGFPVHLIVVSDAVAAVQAEAMRAPLEALGFTVGHIGQAMAPEARREAYAADVVCVPHREVGFDYLRDRMRLRGRPRKLLGALDRLAGEPVAREDLMLPGLQCALVDDADLLMIDDVRGPLVVSTESDQSQQRLIYEQALELARDLEEDEDYGWDERGVALTATGRERLAQLVAALGGIWKGQHRREEIIAEALKALHGMVRDEEYQVTDGRIVFPPPDPDADPQAPPAGELLRGLIEVKEGIRLSGRRDVLARVSLPRFYRRYLRLSGACADVSGVETELWSIYRLKCERFAHDRTAPNRECRVFLNVAAKRRALLETAAGMHSAGRPLLIAVRTPDETAAVGEALLQAGLPARLVRGIPGTEESQALDAAGLPDAVTLSVHPAQFVVNPEQPTHAILLVAELHDSPRHLRASARTYGTVSSTLMFSLDEAVLAPLVGAVLKAAVALCSRADGELPGYLATAVGAIVRRRLATHHALLRQEAMSHDRYLSDILAFSGTGD